MSEKKKLLELLKASLEEDEKASSVNADTLICDAKNEVHKLNFSYKEEMDKIYDVFSKKIDDVCEDNGWDEPFVENLKQEIQDMTTINKTEQGADDDEEEEEDHLEGADGDATEDEHDEDTQPVLKKRGRPKSASKGASASPKKKKYVPAPKKKPTPKKTVKNATSRPRGRTPANMQWSESEGKWVPMKAALRRVVGEAPAGTIWNEEKQEFVPLKAALKRLM